MAEPMSPRRLAEIRERVAYSTERSLDVTINVLVSVDAPDLLTELDCTRAAWQWLQIRADVEHHEEHPGKPHDDCKCRGCWLAHTLRVARDSAPGIIAHRALTGADGGETS